MEGDQSQPREVNILLLGESGAGKSTFINSLANYIEYDSLEEAMHSEIKWKVPARFTVTDENYEEICVTIGNPDTKNYSGHIVTKGVTDYEFHHKDVVMHLIDTPPLRVDDNQETMNKILSFISKLNHINAIAFFLKPGVLQYYKGCLNTLLSCLNTSVFKNIVFVFTHSRHTFYKPGETLSILMEVLKEMSSDTKATIPCSKENMFCLDNETFRYLVAYKHGAMSDDENMKVFSQSWKRSTDCCEKFINYIIGDSKAKGLEPFMIQKIIPFKTNKVYGDAHKLKTKCNEQKKSCGSRPNFKLEHIIYFNEERCPTREKLMQKCKMTSEEYKGNIHKTDLHAQFEKRHGEYFDFIKSQEHINKNQQKSGKLGDHNIFKQDYSYGSSASKNMQRSHDYLETQRILETYLQDESDNSSEEFLNNDEGVKCREENKYKTHPTIKVEDNYYISEQDKSCCPSRAMKQSAINDATDEKRLDKFQLMNKERIFYDGVIQEMHEQYLAIAQEHKELFERLSNRIGVMEMSINEIKHSIQDVHMKLDNF